jgi:transcription antitermination factor NusG
VLSSHFAASLDPALPREMPEPYWYALYTRSRHEKRIADQLQCKQIEHFLPLYEAVHRWRDRNARVSLPLFPGYVFVRLCLADRLQVLQLPGVVRFVSFSGKPQPLPDNQLETLRNGLAHQLRMEPHPFLRIGRRVRIRRGALEGAEGFLLRKKERMRFILSVELLMRSVSVEVDAADVEPI